MISKAKYGRSMFHWTVMTTCNFLVIRKSSGLDWFCICICIFCCGHAWCSHDLHLMMWISIIHSWPEFLNEKHFRDNKLTCCTCLAWLNYVFYQGGYITAFSPHCLLDILRTVKNHIIIFFVRVFLKIRHASLCKSVSRLLYTQSVFPIVLPFPLFLCRVVPANFYQYMRNFQ